MPCYLPKKYTCSSAFYMFVMYAPLLTLKYTWFSSLIELNDILVISDYLMLAFAVIFSIFSTFQEMKTVFQFLSIFFNLDILILCLQLLQFFQLFKNCNQCFNFYQFFNFIRRIYYACNCCNFF